MAVWNAVANEIFLQAAEIASPDERRIFLEAHCGDDGALRAEVESLLSANDFAGGFLESPPELLRSDGLSSSLADRTGTVIGRYRLLEQIGEGGFGVVYRAQQHEPVRRVIALKIIKPGMDTRQVIARFEAERQALALMHHPHIAQVLDGGTTPSGRPYFVMELVDGIPVNQYCDEHSLSTAERLILFLDVCHAVQHAHLKGIIHRDLKPSNILVTLDDGKPLVKVIDFGIAKAIRQRPADEPSITQDAQLIGTPLYMSPEQIDCAGTDVDTRSDVYSLGVVLYELLTGVTPFDRQRFQRSPLEDVRRILCDEEPPAPSMRLDTLGSLLTTVSTHRSADRNRLSRVIRGDLDWIVMKAIDKDRSHRYQTVAELAADIERFQLNEPVSAGPPSAVYRWRKFARRYRVPLTTSALVLAALLVGAGLSVWQAVRATNARSAEIAARRKAEENFKQARAAVDRYFTLVSENELLDVPGVQPLRKDLLSAAHEYYEKFLTQRADDPLVQAELAVACIRLAQVDNALDENDAAIAALNQGLAVVDEFERSGADRRILCERLAGVYRGGRALHRGTRPPTDPDEALKTLRKTAALWNRLVNEDPGNPDLRNDLAGINLHIGDFLRGLRQTEAALQPLQTAANLSEALAHEHVDVAEYRSNQARSQGLLGDVYRRLKKPDEAQAAFRKSLELQEQLVAEYPDVREYRLDLALSLNQTGKRLASEGAKDEAQRALERAYGLLDRLVKDFPHVPIYRESLAVQRFDQARLLKNAGQIESAAATYRDAVVGFQRLVDTYPELPRYREQLAAYARQFALFLFEQEQKAEAADMYFLALSQWDQLVSDFPDELDYVRLLSRHLVLAPSRDLQDAERAMAAAQRAVELAPESADCWSMLGMAQYRAGRAAEAVTALQKGVSLRREANGFDSVCLAMAYSKSGDLMVARECYDRATAWLEANPTRNSADIRRLRAEAAELLQIKIPRNDPPKPSDVSPPSEEAEP